MEKLEEYKEILNRYKNGEFGDEALSLYEILEKAGRLTILDEMSIEEITVLVEKTHGITKSLYLNIRNKKMNAEK